MSLSQETGDGRAARPWLLVAGVIALIAGPLVLYRVLPLIGVPAALASGAVALIALKHLGLLAVLFASLYGVVRRRPRLHQMTDRRSPPILHRNRR